MKHKRKLVTEQHQTGVLVLNLETEAEEFVPYRKAGCGPGYWARVYHFLINQGWNIVPDDFGANISIMINDVGEDDPEWKRICKEVEW